MANKKVNEFAAFSTPAAIADIVYAKQGTTEKKITVEQLRGEIASVDNYYVAGGTANVITLTATGKTVAPSEYFNGLTLEFEIGTTSTAAVTANVNGLGARSVYLNGVALTGGELLTGKRVRLKYNTTGPVFDVELSETIFPNLDAPVTVDSAELNHSAGLTSDTQTQLDGKQPLDTGLNDISGLSVANGNFIVGDGANWIAEAGATARASLGLILGSDVQAYDSDLAAIAALATTAYGRALLTVASEAALKALINLEIGTDVAAAANGVTNGNSHNHVGGDGGSIAFSSLTGSISSGQIPSSTITQSKLSLSLQQTTGSVSSGNGTNVAFTGGTYSLGWGVSGNFIGLDAICANTSGYYAGVRIQNPDTSPHNYWLQARYVNASPPYDLGDGVLSSLNDFIYLIIDNNTNEVVGVDVANALPWIYNGPTKTTADRYGKDGKQYINRFILPPALQNKPMPNAPIQQRVAFQRAMAEFRKTPEIKEEELLPLDKNADWEKIPHPFVGGDLTGKTVVLVDPLSPIIEELSLLRENGYGEDITKMIMEGYLDIGSTALQRKGPAGLMIVDANWKLT